MKIRRGEDGQQGLAQLLTAEPCQAMVRSAVLGGGTVDKKDDPEDRSIGDGDRFLLDVGSGLRTGRNWGDGEEFRTERGCRASGVGGCPEYRSIGGCDKLLDVGFGFGLENSAGGQVK